MPIQITDIPREVLTHIGEYLDRVDLQSLRQCSSEMRDVVRGCRPNDDNIDQIKEKIFTAFFEDNRNIFLTGSAGTGKSTTLSYLHQECARRGLQVAMLAPTQMASEHIPGGQTIHSFLKIRGTLTELQREDIAQRHIDRDYRLTPVDVIVVDEISMVGLRLMDCMDFLLRLAYDRDRTFGGKKVIFCGDLLQIVPVMDKRAYGTVLWNQLHLKTFYLRQPLRQGEDITWFVQLQRIRDGRIRVLSDPQLLPGRVTQTDIDAMTAEGNRPVLLSALNREVERINDYDFNRLPGEVESTLIATDTYYRKAGQQTMPIGYPTSNRYDPGAFYRAPHRLMLKTGARYVITDNLSKNKGITNGRICEYLGNNTFRLQDSNRIVEIDALYSTFHYPVGNGEYLRRYQVAMRLGYALTIHKSQGMTLQRVVVDCSTFRQSGQFYVAMSRTASWRSTYLLNVTEGKKAPVSVDAVRFYQSLH